MFNWIHFTADMLGFV